MARVQVVLRILALLLIAGSVQGASADKEWWETASFYQIYPRSFKDSDGNGIGDLKGITEQLPYLKELGITATWLSPIFKSPMADFGYDISNFYEIDEMFGTMEDFDALIAKAKELGVRIILDYVANHSSDECEWFVKSVAGDPEYKDFYVWHPGKMVNGTRQPPNNWLSVFRGPAWTFNEQRGAYYLHQFVAKQPDLNYRNPKVREAMLDVLRFWVRRGVHGFRVDAILHAFEVEPDANGDYPDEPLSHLTDDPMDHNYLDHIYTTNLPETYGFVYEMRKVMDELREELGGDRRILMTEAYADIDKIIPYYGNATHDGAQIPFNFELISHLTAESNAYHYLELINRWLDNMPAGRTANWVLGNHDRSRVGTRMHADRIDMMNFLLTMLPGCSVTYQGEEIGMTDVWISWEDTIDPAGCQASPETYEQSSRDPVRTPFQWDDSKTAGFTSGKKTWLPIANNSKLVNVKRERGIAMSHLNIYKQLLVLRHDEILTHGATEVKALNANVLAIKRYLANGNAFVTLLNVNDDVEYVNLHTAFGNLGSVMDYVMVTDRSLKRKGDRVATNNVVLWPKESVVLRNIP